MQIKDIMSDPCICVQAGTSLTQVAEKMKHHNIGSIPVCNEAHEVVGIITDRDIVVRCIAEDEDPALKCAKDVMTSSVETVDASLDVAEATRIMAQKQIRRLPVTEDNKVVGMVALGDMATSCYGMESARALTDISE